MSLSNTFCWVDIPVIDLDRAIRFYTHVLSTEVQKIVEHDFEFGLLPHQEDNVSGCLTVMPGRQPSQDGPLVYLNVEGRLAEAVAAVKELGCRVLQNPQMIGPYGHRAIVLDSEGNALALYSKK